MDYVLTLSIGVGTLLGLVALAFVWGVTRRVSRMDTRLDARISALEVAMIRAPTREDFERIDHRLDALTTSLAVTAEQLRSASAGIARIEDFMMQRGARSADA